MERSPFQSLSPARKPDKAAITDEEHLRLWSRHALTSAEKAVDNPQSCMTTYNTNNNKNQGQTMTTLVFSPAQQRLARTASIAARRHRTGFAGG
jgi:hypothetical protein